MAKTMNTSHQTLERDSQYCGCGQFSGRGCGQFSGRGCGQFMVLRHHLVPQFRKSRPPPEGTCYISFVSSPILQIILVGGVVFEIRKKSLFICCELQLFAKCCLGVHYIHLYTLKCVTICAQMACPVSTNNRTAAYRKETNIGMELSMTSCLGVGIFLFPFFFMTSLHPLHFREMIFPLVITLYMLWVDMTTNLSCM